MHKDPVIRGLLWVLGGLGCYFVSVAPELLLALHHQKGKVSIPAVLFTVGPIIVGVGIHKITWAPPRNQSRVPDAWRPLISIALTVVSFVVLSFLVGITTGILRAL